MFGDVLLVLHFSYSDDAECVCRRVTNGVEDNLVTVISKNIPISHSSCYCGICCNRIAMWSTGGVVVY